MSRQEQIQEAAIKYVEEGFPDIFIAGFLYGAMWADKHPNWISVEERLPEVGEIVIFYSPGIDDWLSGAFQQDGTWWNEEYGTHFYDVTHWMEIVPPRKEDFDYTMKIEIDYNGSLAACKVDGKPFNKCDVNEQVFAMEAFRTIIKDWNRESNIFQNGNISQCVECVWHSVDELPMFDRGKDGDMTPFIVDSYYGHIGGVAHSYTRVTWKNHIDTHRNRKFMWAYESDLFPINYKNRLSRVKIKRDIHLESQTQSSIGDIEI